MESEQTQNFNKRLSQWVASQGFWFQIRYSMVSSGAGGIMGYHLMRLVARMMIFVGVLALCGWIYLVKRPKLDSFGKDLNTSLQSGLSATELEVVDFSRIRGQLNIGRLGADGGTNAFYTKLIAKNIRCKMGLLDGFYGPWKPGTLAISQLDMELRAGADDAASAQKLSDSIFKSFPRTEIRSLEVANATVRWGYSRRTFGAIENSHLKIQRYPERMTLAFDGGTFSQNWLRQLDIVTLVVSCNRDGLVFEKALFRDGEGSVDLTGLKVAGGERPQITGIAKIRRLSLDKMLPRFFNEFLEGTISGNFNVSGSTNTTDGIGFAGRAILDGDIITLRERFHLLKAISVIDFARNYYRVDFKEGSFSLKSGGGNLEIKDVDLKAADLLTLSGAMTVRRPTTEEAESQAAEIEKDSALYASAHSDTVGDAKMADLSAVVRDTAEEIDDKKDVRLNAKQSLINRATADLQERQLIEKLSTKVTRTLRYEGEFKISLLPDVFEQSPKLAEKFPVDAKLGRIELPIPIDGNLYNLTHEQSELIYEEGRR